MPDNKKTLHEYLEEATNLEIEIIDLLPTLEDLQKLHELDTTIANIYQSSSNHINALVYYAKALTYLEKIIEYKTLQANLTADEQENFWLKHTEYLIKIAEIHKILSDTQKFKDCLKAAKEILKRFSNKVENDELNIALAACHNNIGQIYHQEEDFHLAKYFYQAAVNRLEHVSTIDQVLLTKDTNLFEVRARYQRDLNRAKKQAPLVGKSISNAINKSSQSNRTKTENNINTVKPTSNISFRLK